MPDHLQRKVIHHEGPGAPHQGAFDSFYLEEIRLQCSFAIRSYREIRRRVAAGSNDSHIWGFVHMLLVFAGNAARLVFPSESAKPTAHDRAKRLRAQINIGETPPRNLFTARNYFEHFDERMDAYLWKVNGLLIHALIAPKVDEEVELDDGRRFQPHFLKLLQTTTYDLTIYDRTINLPDLMKEVGELQQSASAALSDIDSK